MGKQQSKTRRPTPRPPQQRRRPRRAVRSRARPQTLVDQLGGDEGTALEFLWSLREDAYQPTGFAAREFAQLSGEEQRQEMARDGLAVAEAAYHAEKNPALIQGATVTVRW
jgi:hypothetical protein